MPRKAYRRYVQEGIEMGRREEPVGGGLIRTLGGMVPGYISASERR